MAGALTIQLQKVRFFAEHGLHKEEAQIGNEFEVDTAITYKAPKKTVIGIEETVDYVKVHQVMDAVMQERHDLLETVAMLMAERIQQEFNFIKAITISIRKINAPITNFTGSVGVQYSKRFK